MVTPVARAKRTLTYQDPLISTPSGPNLIIQDPARSCVDDNDLSPFEAIIVFGSFSPFNVALSQPKAKTLNKESEKHFVLK